MEVSSVLLDDITVSADRASAAVASTLYEFAKPEWVSVHHERAGRPLGPLALLDSPPSSETLEAPAVKRRHFGARPLALAGPKPPTISYRETWTTPPNCVYALVLPPSCAATQLDIHCPGYRYQPPVEVAATADERVFHYVVLMGEAGTMRVAAIIVADADAHVRALSDSKIVAATEHYGELRKHVRQQAVERRFLVQVADARRQAVRRYVNAGQ